MADPERRFSWQATGRSLQQASIRAFDLSERTARRGWRSQQRRVSRWRSRLFMILQIAVAAGVSWGLARIVLGHPQPYLATVTAIVCLGFSFGQRLSRVVEMAVGVTVGVFLGDVFLHFFGTGVWQIILVVGLAMSITTWLGARNLMVTQSGLQAAAVITILPNFEAGFSRWQDALFGCGVALVLATIAPTGPVRKPRLLAANVLHEASLTLRSIPQAVAQQDDELTQQILQRARASENALASLDTAATEGMAVVRGSILQRHRRQEVVQISELVDPLDRMIRNLRVLARRAAVATFRGESVPDEYLRLLSRLAQAIDDCAAELYAGRRPESVVPELKRLGDESSHFTVYPKLSSTVILAQARSMIVDLMELCGVPYADARGMVPDMD